jgi:two-component system alkaline phosphatase synthesis response regulator PhoP
MKKTLLIIEDDINIAKLIKIYGEEEGFRMLIAEDGKKGVELAKTVNPALIILDRMLPEMEGLEVLKEIRKDKNIPILIASAKADEFEKTLGLELGADDYIAKPFSPKELMARVKAILRRSQNQASRNESEKDLEIGDLTLKPTQLSATQVSAKKAPTDIQFTSIEFKLISYLALHEGQVMSREKLMDHIHKNDEKWVYDRSIDAHIKKIRKKLGDPAKKPRYIESVFGVGYRFKTQK